MKAWVIFSQRSVFWPQVEPRNMQPTQISQIVSLTSFTQFVPKQSLNKNQNIVLIGRPRCFTMPRVCKFRSYTGISSGFGHFPRMSPPSPTSHPTSWPFLLALWSTTQYPFGGSEPVCFVGLAFNRTGWRYGCGFFNLAISSIQAKGAGCTSRGCNKKGYLHDSCIFILYIRKGGLKL